MVTVTVTEVYAVLAVTLAQGLGFLKIYLGRHDTPTTAAARRGFHRNFQYSCWLVLLCSQS